MAKEYAIANEQLKVKISSLGAELQSVKSKQDGYEYIWQADSRYWGRHAPLLFPFIGRSNDNPYLLDGQKYAMKQHGFLRDYEFKLVSLESDQIVLLFESSPETKQVYPYDFAFKVKYQLRGKDLLVRYRIDNFNDKKMCYSLGFHPAFNLEGDLADYRLEVDPKQTELTSLLIDPAPFRSGKEEKAALKDGSLPLSWPMLDKGLKIYKADAASHVKLASGHQHAVTLDISDFPYLAVWSPEEKQAPFVCVEPFRGLPDRYGRQVELSEKDGEQWLFPEMYNQITTTLSFD